MLCGSIWDANAGYKSIHYATTSIALHIQELINVRIHKCQSSRLSNRKSGKASKPRLQSLHAPIKLCITDIIQVEEITHPLLVPILKQCWPFRYKGRSKIDAMFSHPLKHPPQTPLQSPMI